MLLTPSEQGNGSLTYIEVDAVFGFTCHVTTDTHAVAGGGRVVLQVWLADTGYNGLFHDMSSNMSE